MLIYYLKKESKYVLPQDYIIKNSKLSQPRAMLVNWLLKIQVSLKNCQKPQKFKTIFFSNIINPIMVRSLRVSVYLIVF